MVFSHHRAALEEVRATQIHGAPFYDIVDLHSDQAGARPESAGIGGEMIYPSAHAGDRVLIPRCGITNTVTQVEKL